MKKEINIEEKTIHIYYDEENKINSLPVVVLNTFDEDENEIWKLSKEFNCKDYIFVTISIINWNKEMSPWFMEKLYKNDEDYLGKADEYLELLENKIIPEIVEVINKECKKEISYFVLAGYSLAGLFSVYSMYKTSLFKRIISCSGSFWYPDFIKFVEENNLRNRPEKIYFSLGNKESKTKNEMLAKVEENTKYLVDFYKKQDIDTIYEENEGNHFQDAYKRIIKGIYWTLETK